MEKNNVDISGATGSSLTIDPVLASDAGSYDVVVTNDCGSVTSTPVALTTSTLPVITQQPANQTDCFDQSVEFTAAATNGEAPYSFSWEMRKTTADVWVSTGGNSSTLLVSNIGTGNNINGSEYRVTITDACGNSTAVSSIAMLTVNQMDLKTLLSETVCQGGITTFTAATLGSSPVGYVGQLNGSTISNGGAYSGATAQTLTISNAQLAQNGTYSVSAVFNITQPNNNGAGITTCQAEFIPVGELVVEEGPDIVASLSSQSICSGTAITEIVLSNANGTPGTTYSWTRDNTTVLTGIPATGFGNIINGTLTSLDPSNSHTTIFTVTASTINGCISTKEVSVTVEDNEAPTNNFCPGDFTVSTGAGICGAIVNYTAPTFNDNCDGNGLAGTLVSGLASGDEFPPGPTTVTWEYTDAAGNGPVTCSFVVTVNDDVDPTALCQNITVQLDASGNAVITADQIDFGSSDPCGAVTLSVDKTTFNCDNVGINNVILTVEDVNGNTATCSATVTVEDNIEPTAFCKDITVQLDASGNVTIAPPTSIMEAVTIAGQVTLSATPTTFNCTNVGDNTVVLTVTDENGGIKTCDATVTVEDNIAPTVLCRDFTVQLDGSGNATITVNDIDNGSTDNCAIAKGFYQKPILPLCRCRTNNVTLTVTDVNGNQAFCSATVTIEDIEDPVAVCQNITVQLDASGNATITAADIDNGSTDNCGAVTLSIDKTTFLIAIMSVSTL
ncbi:MAG: HYR domain-containing protein [Draconibacterium sp.]|nr:HYR domain-containing protein [Draconibacterium sp.]